MNATLTPAQAALLDARMTLDMLLAGTFGDADPARLLDAAIASLQSIRAEFEGNL